jgi:phage shock protein A
MLPRAPPVRRAGAPLRWYQTPYDRPRRPVSGRRGSVGSGVEVVHLGVFKRMTTVFQEKANAALDKAEDPTQALDLSYSQLVEQLQKVRQAIAESLTAVKRLEGQQAQLQAQYDKLQGQARQALAANREDLARTALQRAETIQAQLSGLSTQIEQARAQEQQLEVTGEKLKAKVESFRAQRDTMKASYSAAKATSAAVEGVSGLSEHMADVSMTLDRAQDKISQMQARAAAVSQLSDSGVLDSLELSPVGGADDLDAQLRAASGGVDSQLEALKAEMGLKSGPPQGAIAAPAPEAPAEVAAPAPPSALPAADASGTMVVRIVGEGQWRVPAGLAPALDGLDEALLSAINDGDESSYNRLVGQLTKLIKAQGNALANNDLSSSDLVVPGDGMTLDEARRVVGPPASQAEGSPSPAQGS